MNNPLHFSRTGPLPAASRSKLKAGSRAVNAVDHPTPEDVGFEVGVILAVTLGIACAVPLALSVCGID
jgi:hypothetical protein